MTDHIFYVYLIFDTNCVPRYVGKGKAKRAFDSARNSHNKQLRGMIRKATAAGKEMPVVFLAEHLTEEQSFEYERLWISTIGRLDLGLGSLLNHTDGGDGVSGAIHTEERRRNISLFQKGRPKSVAMRTQLSKSTTERMSRPDELERVRVLMTERMQDPEECRKASERMTERMQDPVFREAAIKNLIMYNTSPEGREVARQRMIARHNERRARLAEASKLSCDN